MTLLLIYAIVMIFNDSYIISIFTSFVCLTTAFSQCLIFIFIHTDTCLSFITFSCLFLIRSVPLEYCCCSCCCNCSCSLTRELRNQIESVARWTFIYTYLCVGQCPKTATTIIIHLTEILYIVNIHTYYKCTYTAKSKNMILLLYAYPGHILSLV